MLKLVFICFFTLTAYADPIFLPLPKNIENTDSKIVALGEALFFDTLLSKNKDISCFSCHSKYGADNTKVSFGTNGHKGTINSPSVFNLQFQIAFFWNGRSQSLKDQSMGPITMKHEMGMDKNSIERRLNSSIKYKKLFQEAFGKAPSFELVIDALVAFEKTLITPNSKFDRFLREEVTLNENEAKGFELFNNYGCVTCHNGINLGGNSFQKFGALLGEQLFEPKINDRYSFTKNEDDIGIYKVPSLRNVTKTAPYFHTGAVNELKTAIKIMGLYNLGRDLDDNEILYIESFLNTLTGELPLSYQKRITKEN